MKIKFSPQRNDEKIIYTFQSDTITATYQEQTEAFDFSNIPNGKLEEVETNLAINPLLSAKKEDGILYVELLNFIGEDATEEERFPTWFDAGGVEE